MVRAAVLLHSSLLTLAILDLHACPRDDEQIPNQNASFCNLVGHLLACRSVALIPRTLRLLPPQTNNTTKDQPPGPSTLRTRISKSTSFPRHNNGFWRVPGATFTSNQGSCPGARQMGNGGQYTRSAASVTAAYN